MKYFLIQLLIFVCSFLAPGTMLSDEKALLLKVSNPSKYERTSETIAIRWSELKAKLSSLDKSLVGIFDAISHAEILSQDAEDELIFQSSFKALETKTLIIKNQRLKRERPKSLVDGRFVEPRQDYAWENDRIAFRVYGPALAKEVNNGIDVWTKRVRHLVVEKWYKGEEDTGAAKISYHIDHGEGADFFSVGKSLGAGSCGIWYNHRVYQPGVFSSYKTIANGPVRLIFELRYNRLDVEGTMYSEVKRITIDAGHNLNRIEVVYDGPTENEELQFACGLVKRKNVTLVYNADNRWMSLWGPTNDDSTNGSLGTGIVMPSSNSVSITEEKDQYLACGKTRSGRSFVYYAGAGWTRSGDFASVQDWNEYLHRFSINLQAPLDVQMELSSNRR